MAVRRPPKVLPISRPLLLFQFAGLVGMFWLLGSQWAPLKASESPIRVVGIALFWLLLAWGCAFGMTLWTYMATSLDPFRALMWAALRASVHALWFVPAMLLVMKPAAPWVVAIGLVLMVNAARLLVANPPPQRRLLSRRALRASHRLFGESRVERGFFSKETSPALLGAFSLQAGSFAIWAGYPHWSAPLLAGGMASWTWASIARGAYPLRKRKHRVHAELNILLALMATIALSVIRLGVEPAATGEAPGLLESTRRELQQAINPPPAKPAAAPQRKSSPVRLVSAPVVPDVVGKGGIPGLILQPGKKTAQSLTIPPSYRMQVTLSPTKPVSIPFTGEYHLFRESSVQLPPGADLRTGSPMDSVYVTTNGGAMETDAYQEFDPPVDFSSCARVRMSLISGELFPASATLMLLGAESLGEFGPEIFGMSADPEETIEFALPPLRSDVKVRGIRVIFRHNPMEASHSTRVAIQRFTFLPRGCKTCALTFAGRVIYSDDSTWAAYRAVLRMSENSKVVPEAVERHLDSTLESVDNAEELAVGVAQRAGLGDDDLMKIGLAVRESMVNAVMHGNRYSSDKKVRFSVVCNAERFTVRIADEGEGFQFEAVPDPLAPENLMRTSGRGIFLIRSFMDDFQMRHLESGGTEVTLVKHLVSK